MKRGYASGFEMETHETLKQHGCTAEYEPFKIPYVLETNYTPDFVLPNGIVIETKGYFPPDERKKMLLVHKQHPDIDIRIVLYAPTRTISKISKTTYAIWCTKNGLAWGTRFDLLEWAKERKNERRIKALKAIGYELE